MSLLVGKRNFIDTFGEAPLSLHSGFQSNGKLFKSNGNQSLVKQDPAKFLVQKNLELLKSLYDGVEEKELISALEDCDNNLELAKQVVSAIKKDKYLNFEELKIAEPSGLDREIRSLNSKHKSHIQVSKPQLPKTDMMDESVEKRSAPVVQKSSLESTCKELSTYLMNGMQNSVDIDTAREFLGSSLKNFFESQERKYDAVLKKEKEEKSIMIRSFLKLREKIKVLTEKNTEYLQIINTSEKELQDLRSTSYKLGLLLKSLDSQQIDEFSNEVF